MRFIKLDRPLAVFDIEATGLNARTDKIIELSVIRIETNGARSSQTWLLNPGCPIPIETIAIHGIDDDMVKDCPKFEDVADEIFHYFEDCDLAGFGMGRLDIPILEEEFLRCNLKFNPNERRQFDAQRIFHKKEPRDLSAAMRFYCNEELTDAHGAEADTEATLRVLEGEFAKYEDLPTDPEQLDRLINDRDPFMLDRDGRLRWLDGEITINFGKKKGLRLRDLIIDEPSFIKWMLRGDFGHDTKEILKNAMEGKWPTPPPSTPTSQSIKL
jgi:DNA polymerase-3 subunit epsilon